jgi:hypothetical protein
MFAREVNNAMRCRTRSGHFGFGRETAVGAKTTGVGSDTIESFKKEGRK